MNETVNEQLTTEELDSLVDNLLSMSVSEFIRTHDIDVQNMQWNEHAYLTTSGRVAVGWFSFMRKPSDCYFDLYSKKELSRL